MLTQPLLRPRRLGNVGRAHAMDGEQLFDEFGLFENAQPLVLPGLHQLQDSVGFFFTERNVRNAVEMQLLGTAEAFEAVEQDAGVPVSTPCSGSSMPRAAMSASRRASRSSISQPIDPDTADPACCVRCFHAHCFS